MNQASFSSLVVPVLPASGRPTRFQRRRGAALDHALEDRGHLVGRMRVDDLGPVVGDFGLLLVLPGIGLAALADALVVAPDGGPQRSWMRSISVGPHLLAAIGEHAVAGRQPHERRLAGAERHGQHGQQIVVDAEALGVVDDDRHAEVLRKPHRHLVARVLDAEAQGRGAGGVLLLVVLRLPDVLVRALLDLDRRIEHDRRRLVAVVDRGRVDERLERGAGLALGLDGAVELAHGEGKAADDGEHAARVADPSRR